MCVPLGSGGGEGRVTVTGVVDNVTGTVASTVTFPELLGL